MPSIIREIEIAAPVDDVWAAVRDFHAAHRLAPGFVVDSSAHGDDTRVVTFFSGAVAREVLIGVDDGARRLAYSVVDSPLGFTHHNASAQVVPAGDGPDAGSRFVWTADLLPGEAAGYVAELMERGLAAAKQALEARSGATAG